MDERRRHNKKLSTTFIFLGCTETLSQQATITAGRQRSVLSFWYRALSKQTGTDAVDTLKVQITDTAGNVLATLGSFSNLNKDYWNFAGYDLSQFNGRTVIIKLTGTEASTTVTDFFVDDFILVTYQSSSLERAGVASAVPLLLLFVAW